MKYTKKRKYSGGVHTREDVQHYHYFVKYPNGSTRHVSDAQHCVSAPAKKLPKGETFYSDNTCAVESWKINTLIDAIKENMLKFKTPFDTEKPFTIFVAPETNTTPLTYFKIYSGNSNMLPLNTKLRDIRFDVPDVGTQTLTRSSSTNPFIFVYNEELSENPKYDYLKEALDARVALNDEKNEFEPDTSSSGLARGIKTIHHKKRRTKKRKTKRRQRK